MKQLVGEVRKDLYQTSRLKFLHNMKQLSGEQRADFYLLSVFGFCEERIIMKIFASADIHLNPAKRDITLLSRTCVSYGA